MEFSVAETPWTDELFEPVLSARDGHVAIPDGLGWGVTINPAWLEKSERRISELD